MIATRWYWLGLIGGTTLIAIAYFYFQKQLGLPPCPLCMIQRGCLAAVSFFCFLGLIFRPKKIVAKIIAFFVTLFSIFGVAVAGRQVWLQHLPADQVPACGPGLDYMLQAFPLQKVINKVFSGSGECAEVHWQLLGFSMAEWMVLIFVVMTLLSFRLLFSKERSYFSGTYGR